MSWCRWSSMEFACDLYVYESDAGVEVHVATRRPLIDRSSLPPGGEPASDAWFERHRALMALLDTSDDYEAIDLPHAGQSRTFDDMSEAADWIDALDALGYVVPADLVDDMRSHHPPGADQAKGAAD